MSNLLPTRRPRVLVACEFSGIIRDAFAASGCDAWSCDLADSERDSANHLQCDVRDVLHDGWDLMIAHPPCKYLAYSGSRVWHTPGRAEKRAQAMEFFKQMYYAPIPRICVENPLGEPCQHIKHSQIIHPYFFGDPFQKRTLLWLRNLPLLRHYKEATLFEPKTWADSKGEMQLGADGKIRAAWLNNAYAMAEEERVKVRSRTFAGIAQAMAAQWSPILKL